jgi:adenosylcobalamin-dependent ribonucleoside-triphosphate reductase
MHREYFPGVGQAVADRTINRNGEHWGQVATRVATGNTLLHPTGAGDFNDLEQALASGQLLMSGRHLQHGDADQPKRNLEVFTNCSTASQRSTLFYLLLNGSGVGTSYDDDMQVVDWHNMPRVVPVIAADHADADGSFKTLQQAKDECHALLHRDPVIFNVPDSREGWAEAVQAVENMAFEGTHRHTTLILEFSGVRCKGSPIGGMQERPSSGPVPLMEAMVRINRFRDERLPLWQQSMIIDHLLAEIVLVGGARRAARIAVKWWEDEDILDFINIKQTAGLWTANNSIGVDARFWSLVAFVKKHGHCLTLPQKKAWEVFKAATNAQYHHGTGEPGFLNLDLISQGESAESGPELGGRMVLTGASLELRAVLTGRALLKKYPVIVNPCGEIRLHVNGGYCVIADVAAAFCEDLAWVSRLATRALIRTNLMESLYDAEVKRTNRIGVGLTGIHEYAWTAFGMTFWDLIEEGDDDILDANGVTMKAPRYPEFWNEIERAALAVRDECQTYSAELGVVCPLTERTIKPAGTTSKLFGLTEGAHLPPMGEYLRWVQFSHGDPLIAYYEGLGYPVRHTLKSYTKTAIVGFPTKLLITDLMGDKMVTAMEASPVEQVRWLRLLETYWLLAEGGNQVSYTLKYDPAVISEADYEDFILTHVPNVRAVCVMPKTDTSAYEYLPEDPVSSEEYAAIVAKITAGAMEDIGQEHVECAGGSCPIDFNRTASNSARVLANLDA